MKKDIIICVISIIAIVNHYRIFAIRLPAWNRNK
jgi:hypothetical protein